ALQENPAERAATVHYSFLPEEVHLKAGGQRQTTIHLCCIGTGAANGKIQFLPPQGITVDPREIDVTGMTQGDERDAAVTLKSDAALASGLYPVQIESSGGVAAHGELTASVGVVMTRDTRLPLMAQSLIRAPGYTLRLDHRGGVASYILDS